MPFSSRSSLGLLSLFTALLTVWAPSSYAHVGGANGGGGDRCEDRFKIVANEIKAWVQNDGGIQLKMDAVQPAITHEQYKDAMSKQIATNFRITCVSKGEPGYPVLVNGHSKECRSEVFKGLVRFTCDRQKFYSEVADPENDPVQYRIVHHEFATLAGLEVPDEDDSHYEFSDQLRSTELVMNRLAKTTPFSVLYAASEGKALVGLMDVSGRFASFVDCSAPHGEPDARLALKDVKNCVEIPGSRFLYSEEYGQKINDAYPANLERLYNEVYRREQAEKFGGHAHLSEVELMYFVPFTFVAVGMTVAAFANRSYWSASLGVVGSLIMIASTTAQAYGLYESVKAADMEADVPSLESGIVTAYQKIATKSPTLSAAQFAQQNSEITFNLVRQAILDSISQANSL